MNSKNTDRTQLLHNLIGIVIIIIGIIISFVMFYHSNVTRIAHQNENYLADIVSQRASMIDDLFSENMAYIESSSIALETAFKNEKLSTDKLKIADDGDLDPRTVTAVSDILKVYEERFAFDYLRFIDMYGRDYTTGEDVIAAVVSERDYYKKGIQGKTGITYVLDSKVTNERQIGFYCPVYQDGQIAGVVVGFYGENYINNLLSLSMFDHECGVTLCYQDGTVIYSTGLDESVSNLIDEIKAISLNGEEDENAIIDAFRSRKTALYNYKEGGQTTVGCMAYVGEQSDFFLALHFPAAAYAAMVSNASMNGVKLLISLLALFAAAAIFYIVRFLIQKRKLIEETKNSNDIHFAMSRLFENFVIVKVPTRTYHYIEGMPDIGHIPTDGAYDLFAEDLLSRFPDKKEQAESARLISFDHLVRQMNEGANVISCNLHAPINEEEWFTYNFIVVSRDEDGKVEEFIIARQDVTKLQEKEEEIRRILEKARDDAEKGNRAKSDFLSSMSHDIRTPMNAIIGYTNIAIDNAGNDELVSNSLKKISASSHYLLSLINDVLDMSKIESGKVQLRDNECDLRQIFERIADLTRSQAAKKDLHITYDTDEITHPYVIVDELRLEQILINISGNAVKYTPDGGEISIRAVEEKTDSDDVCRYRFIIRDTGMGMSEDFLPHIFESFSRETTSTINKIQGTGLGMAITSRLVGLMGGDIAVSSKLGEGSEFTVTMDLHTWDGEGRSGTVTEHKITPEELHLAGRRILLVEDNDINAEIAGLVLSSYGIETERASNGREGLDMVRDKGDGYYDAVLMDIQMPVMNGYEAARAIREIGSSYTDKLPVIAMSANAYEEDIRESIKSGMNGHIPKPFEPDDLATVLSRHINKEI